MAFVCGCLIVFGVFVIFRGFSDWLIDFCSVTQFLSVLLIDFFGFALCCY